MKHKNITSFGLVILVTAAFFAGMASMAVILK